MSSSTSSPGGDMAPLPGWKARSEPGLSGSSGEVASSDLNWLNWDREERNWFLGFLRMFRTVECPCCEELVGFQDKANGVVFSVCEICQVNVNHEDPACAGEVAAVMEEVNEAANVVEDVDDVQPGNGAEVQVPEEVIPPIVVAEEPVVAFNPQPGNFVPPPSPQVPKPPEVQAKPKFIPPEARQLGWIPLTPEEEMELADLSSRNPFFRETKAFVEKAMHDYSSAGQKVYEYYVFRLDNAELQDNFTYKIQDLPLVNERDIGLEMEFQITQYKSLGEVIVQPTAETFRKKKILISDKIGKWMRARGSSELQNLRPERTPAKDEMCIVQWPLLWQDVCNLMEKRYGETWWEENKEDFNRLSIFYEDYTAFSGRWFRAACETHYCIVNNKEPEIYEMFLVDLGITTLIPAQNVYKIPHRFMFDYQIALFLSIKLDRITQYSDEVDEKWKYLLLPGMKIKAKVLWMYDEIIFVRLIEPSEREFDAHFRQPFVVTAIQKQKDHVRERQRYRKVKKMSVVKGSFPKNMKNALDQEAADAAFKQSTREYAGIGRIHPKRVFELSLPLAAELVGEGHSKN